MRTYTRHCLANALTSYNTQCTQVALGQLDARKRLPGGPGGLVDLVQACPIVVEVRLTD